MDDLRVGAVGRLEAELAEHLEHGRVLGKNFGRQFFQAGRTGKANQVLCQRRANPLSLISVDHDKSDFSFARLGHDVAVFNSTKAQTVLTNHHDGTWTAVGPDGTDLLQNIEVARFSDGDVLLSPLRGDLNSDGFSDLILQFTDGTVAAWEQHVGGNLAAAVIGIPGSVWSVKGVIDFNGDSKADLLFQSSSNGE